MRLKLSWNFQFATNNNERAKFFSFFRAFQHLLNYSASQCGNFRQPINKKAYVDVVLLFNFGKQASLKCFPQHA
jgi:hypothetical protein